MKTPLSSTSRRSFLKTALAAVPAAFASGALARAQGSALQAAASTGDSGPLPKRQLGKNGPQVTMVTLGG